MRMKKMAFTLGILGVFLGARAVEAKDEYIYRQRVNWVKVEKGDSDVVSLGSIRHPVRSITADQMEAMLLSVKISRRFVLKKEVENADVFNSWEARKFAPYIVEGLSKAGNDQVVGFAVIHKRPMFILQNDRLSMGYVWVADDGVHFHFTKLFAKIDGDYQASAHIDKAIRRAKSLRVSLEAGPGQKLSYNSPMEVIMESSHDFMAQTANERIAERQKEEEEMRGSRPAPVDEEGRAPKSSASQSSASRPASSSGAGGSVAERLKQLEALKAQKLVNEAEYQKLRQKILSEI